MWYFSKPCLTTWGYVHFNKNMAFESTYRHVSDDTAETNILYFYSNPQWWDCFNLVERAKQDFMQLSGNPKQQLSEEHILSMLERIAGTSSKPEVKHGEFPPLIKHGWLRKLSKWKGKKSASHIRWHRSVMSCFFINFTWINHPHG